MYTKTNYSVSDFLKWTRLEIGIFFLVALIPTILYVVFHFHWLSLPWAPFALVGTAMAFILGFQNNAAYERIWEARKIWGGIVNYSRTWGTMVKDMVTNEHADQKLSDKELYYHVKILVHRHIAWLTALRYAMRQSRPWEVVMEHRANKEWKNKIHIPEYATPLEDELKNYLSDEELKQALAKTNKSTALLTLQSSHIRALKEKGLIWEFAFLELENVIKMFYELQGKSERIKNFPYPRQYASLSHYYVRIFILFLPLGVIPQFSEMGKAIVDSHPLMGSLTVWLSIPVVMLVAWIFNTMQRIGASGENPFEGTGNDVPISSISRGIEIDLREMIDEPKEDIPEKHPELHHVQM